MDDIKNFDALCVIWKNPYTNKKYRIGILCKDKKTDIVLLFYQVDCKMREKMDFILNWDLIIMILIEYIIVLIYLYFLN